MTDIAVTSSTQLYKQNVGEMAETKVGGWHSGVVVSSVCLNSKKVLSCCVFALWWTGDLSKDYIHINIYKYVSHRPTSIFHLHWILQPARGQLSTIKSKGGKGFLYINTGAWRYTPMLQYCLPCWCCWQNMHSRCCLVLKNTSAFLSVAQSLPGNLKAS